MLLPSLSFRARSSKVRGMDGLSKLAKMGLGYYQDGCCCDQGDAETVAEDSLGRIAPAVLKLDGLVSDLQRIGDPFEATVQDEKSRSKRKR